MDLNRRFPERHSWGRSRLGTVAFTATALVLAFAATAWACTVGAVTVVVTDTRTADGLYVEGTPVLVSAFIPDTNPYDVLALTQAQVIANAANSHPLPGMGCMYNGLDVGNANPAVTGVSGSYLGAAQLPVTPGNSRNVWYICLRPNPTAFWAAGPTPVVVMPSG